MSRITIRLDTGDPTDLILAARAVRYLIDNPELDDAWLIYGDTKRIPIRRTKAGFAMSIQRIEE